MQRINFLLLIVSFVIFSSFTLDNTTEKKIKDKTTIVQISTSLGNIIVKLYDETPLHRDNFIKLAKEGYYNTSIFHRIIKNFMIQGGGGPDGNSDAGYKIPAEFVAKYYHKRGTLCAAREGDEVNPTKASSGSQFYIVEGKVFTKSDLDMIAKRMNRTFTEEQIKTYTTIGGTPHLDGTYTVFGEVIEGMDVVVKIASVKTDARDKPLEDVKITQVKVLKKYKNENK